MESLFLPYKNSSISYYRLGNGPKTAVCFHGYGEDATSFAFLEKFIGTEYTLYAIDLPFHGKTEWNEKLNFSTTDLLSIIEEITQQSERFTFIGYSLGGRVALSLYQKTPDQTDAILLLAPDGLKINFWYWLSTQTWIGNKLFFFTMKYPDWFITFLKLIQKLGLANASVLKFVSYYIHDKKARIKLFNRWTSLRKLKPGLRGIKTLIKKNKTPVHLIYGEYDRIILSSRGEKFRKGIEETCSLKIIASGHQLLNEKYIKEILAAIHSKPGND